MNMNSNIPKNSAATALQNTQVFISVISASNLFANQHVGTLAFIVKRFLVEGEEKIDEPGKRWTAFHVFECQREDETSYVEKAFYLIQICRKHFYFYIIQKRLWN